MPTFQYRGRNQRGEPVVGRIEAASIDLVANQLFNTGITPVDIIPIAITRDVLAALRLPKREGKVELNDLIFFCRQMYTLIKAGVPILQSLRGLRDSTQNPALIAVIGTIIESLDAGLDLTSAFRRHPRVFPTLFVSLVQVGETTGSLDNAFLQLSRYLELERDTRDRVRAAMRYPALVLSAIALAMFVINIFVIPTFAKTYANYKAELPWATRILIDTSNFTVAYWPAILVGFAASLFAFRLYIGTPNGRYWWHKTKLNLPVVGGILYRAALGRFARALTITTRSGVPLIQGLTVISRAVDNDFVGGRIIQMRDGVERGESITRTAAMTGLFPAMVLQMIQVGEESGAVDELMNEVAEYYEREVDHQLKNLSSAIEPILITAIGVMVLILALGVFLPMWDLVQVARR